LCCGPWLEGDFTNFEGVINLASTNKTENLKLSQWEAGDAFTREDLNADFRAIDAAAGQGGGFTRLKTVSVEAAGKKQIDVDVSDINFCEWQYIMMDVSFDCECKVTLNNDSYWSYCKNLISSEQVQSDFIAKASDGTRLIFLPFERDGMVSVISQGSHSLYFGYSEEGNYYSELSLVNLLSNNGSALSGKAEFTFWGLK